MLKSDEAGKRYLELRREGMTSHGACIAVRREFKVDVEDVTVRAWGAKARQLEPGVHRRPKVSPLATGRVTFRVIPELLKLFKEEAEKRKMRSDSLINMILFERYTKGESVQE